MICLMVKSQVLISYFISLSKYLWSHLLGPAIANISIETRRNLKEKETSPCFVPWSVEAAYVYVSLNPQNQPLRLAFSMPICR